MTMKAVAAFWLAALLSVAAPTMINVAGVSPQAGIAYAQDEGDGDNNQGGTNEPDGDNNQGGTNEPDGGNNQCDDGLNPAGLPCL